MKRLQCGPALHYSGRFTDTNLLYRTGSVKIWKSRHKMPAVIRIFFTVYVVAVCSHTAAARPRVESELGASWTSSPASSFQSCLFSSPLPSGSSSAAESTTSTSSSDRALVFDQKHRIIKYSVWTQYVQLEPVSYTHLTLPTILRV